MHLKCALAFSTLLSSQVTDAHLRETFVSVRGNHSTLPGSVSGVNWAPRNFADSLTLPHLHVTPPGELCARARQNRKNFLRVSRRLWPLSRPFRPGKKNSRGARHVRQIEVRNLVLTQVKHDVTECSRMEPVEPGPERVIWRRQIDPDVFTEQARTRTIRGPRCVRSPHIGAGIAHQDNAPLTSTAPTVRLPTRKIR